MMLFMKIQGLRGFLLLRSSYSKSSWSHHRSSHFRCHSCICNPLGVVGQIDILSLIFPCGFICGKLIGHLSISLRKLSLFSDGFGSSLVVQIVAFVGPSHWSADQKVSLVNYSVNVRSIAIIVKSCGGLCSGRGNVDKKCRCAKHGLRP